MGDIEKSVSYVDQRIWHRSDNISEEKVPESHSSEGRDQYLLDGYQELPSGRSVATLKRTLQAVHQEKEE